MSLLPFPEGMNSVWNNEAFDNGESEDSSAIMKSSWSPSKSSLGLNPSESVDYFSDKENKGFLENSSLSVVVKSPMPFKTLSPDGVLENSRIKTNKAVSKLGFAENSSCDWDEKKIDREMEDIEREINRLSLRLEALRIEKFEKSVKDAENRRVNGKISEEQRRTMEEGLTVSAKTKMPRRCLSLCPGDIAVTKKRVSLGPAEYLNSGQLGKKERMVTPIQASQSRRKSCFWKLEDIGEEMVPRERGKKSLSLSPRSRKSTLRNQASRQVATTIASKKTVKKEDGLVSSIQPKKLFKDGEKSVATTKAPRPGRVVASRYNQNTAQVSAVRKRSLPENDIDGSKQCDKKRSVLVGKSTTKSAATEMRVKKRWEIPSELVVHTSSEADDDSPKAAIVVPDLLPRIKISRCINETPRDSGQAKRVVDLIGRKTYFSIDEEDETSVCQSLSFAEDEDEEN